MPGDYSRKTFDPRKHYSAVLMQQGRVQLDSDGNEQAAIGLHRTHTEARDVIGACGVPKKTDSFKIGLTPDETDLTIAPGRIYVGGMLCELEATAVVITAFVEGSNDEVELESLIVDNRAFEAGQWVEIAAENRPQSKLARIVAVDVNAGTLTLSTDVSEYQDSGVATVRRITTYLAQPDYPSPEFSSSADSPPIGSPSSPPALSQLSLEDGHYLLFLDVWQREITALDDPLIREKALGGPDTATRLKTIWQLKILSVTVPEGGEASCQSSFLEWDDETALSTGRLNARTQPAQDPKNPCLLPPTAGYRRLENQLYRVEVQKGGDLTDATFKWSRDNATVETRILGLDGNKLTVADLGRDEVLGFTGGQWVEIVDLASELSGLRNPLVQIDGVDPATRTVTLKSSAAAHVGKAGLKLRRWDQSDASATADGLSMTGDWQDVEAGIQVRFAEGTYQPGDYWLIPARTATGDIEWPPFATPNTDPIPQPPVGIRHHFCRLALAEVTDGAIALTDCRHEFPPLTDICAEDVCFDNSVCKLPDTENVQDAIERLCGARDLRHHNKHLHGWGIVCGLQVRCGPNRQGEPRRHVTVRPGYAIDCEGNDIVLKTAASLDILEMMEDISSPPIGSPPGEIKNADVCLVLDLDEENQSRFRLEKYDPAWNSLQSILSGTLLMDVFNDCLKSLVDFVMDEFTADPEEGKLVVGPTQKRLTAFSNLLIQLINRENGSFVFLSGDKNQAKENFEDTILREFYNKLRGKLQSHTFCAMFEGARPFPEYPFSRLQRHTIFSKGFQTRLRIDPQNEAAYTFGAGSKINIFDLEKNEMVAETEFPGGSSAVVQDVAFSPEGDRIYAIAILGNKDSMFAAGRASNFKVAWEQPHVLCDCEFVTLGTRSDAADRVYAVAKGKGVYEINPDNVTPEPQPMYPFNATGQMVISDRTGEAFATAAATGASPDRYNQVLRLNLKTVQDNPLAFVLPPFNDQPQFGQDDIALVIERQRPTKLCVVANPVNGETTKRLVVFNPASPTAATAGVDLGEDTTIRLAHNATTRQLMVTYEDSYRVGLVNAENRLVENFRAPVQISPLAIATAPNRKMVYVLNYGSNTLSAIPATRFDPENQLDLQALVNYRTAVLNAFADLLGGLLQYLKDCLCDHFLVNCPTCDEEDKIYLACIHIKDGQVFNVCNFSRRKYVKSFPTVEYWLSLIPVLPLFKKAVEKFCCAVLPNFFGKFNAPHAEVETGSIGSIADNRLKGARLRQSVGFVQRTDFRSELRKQVGSDKIKLGGTVAGDWFNTAVVRKERAPEAAIRQNDLVGQPVEVAREKLEAANINVETVRTYDPRAGGGNLTRLLKAPTRLSPGSRVTLVEEKGVVRFYELAEKAPAPIEELRADIEATRAAIQETERLRNEVTALKAELSRTQRQHEEALSTRDQQIAEMKTQVTGFAANIRTLDTLKRQVEALSRPRSRRTRGGES